MKSLKKTASSVLKKASTILLVNILSFMMVVPAYSQSAGDYAKAKFQAKIEKVIVGKILDKIKENDYDTYRLLSAFWKGLKNQSTNSILRNLKQLLIEKGFVYTVYLSGRKFVREGLATTLFAKDFVSDMKKQQPGPFKSQLGTYRFTNDFISKYIKYYKKEDLNRIRGKFINYYRSKEKNVKVKYSSLYKKKSKGKYVMPSDAIFKVKGKEIAEELLSYDKVPFKKNFAFENPKVKKGYVDMVINSCKIMWQLEVGFWEGKTSDRYDFTEKWVRGRVRNKNYKKVLAKYKIKIEDLDDAYLDIVSFMIRMTISGNKADIYNKDMVKFKKLVSVIHKAYPEFDETAISMSQFINETFRLMEIAEKKQNWVDYSAWSLLQNFISNLLNEVSYISDEYKSKASFYGLFTGEDSHYIQKSLLGLWYEEGRNEEAAVNSRKEFIVSGLKYWKFKKLVEFTAMVTDYIIQPNSANLIRTFKKFTINTLFEATKEIKTFKKAIDKADVEAKKAGFNKDERDFFEGTLKYSLNAMTFSEYLESVKTYLIKKTAEDIYSKEKFLLSLRRHLDKSVFRKMPVFQNLILTVADNITYRKSIMQLKHDIKELEPDLFSELVSLGKSNMAAFGPFREMLEFAIPVVGVSLAATFLILGNRNSKNFESIVTSSYRTAIFDSISKLPSSIRDVTEPFIRLAVNALIFGEKTSIKEYTGVATDLLKKLEESSRAFYFALGFSFGHFAANETFQNGSSKLFLADKIGIDFIGLASDLSDTKQVSPIRMGLFAGGFLDFALSESLKIDTRDLPGGNNYMKAGVFMAFDHPKMELASFDVSAGLAFNFSGSKTFFVAASWNLFDIGDLF